MRWDRIFLGILSLSYLGWPSPQPVRAQRDADHLPGVVLVGWWDVLPADEGLAIREIFPGERMAFSIPDTLIYRVRVPVGQERGALERLLCDPRVRFAELDYAVRATAVVTPNDPGWPQQWNLERIALPATWRWVEGTRDLTIAILDSGVQVDHPDLMDNLWLNPGEIWANGVDDDDNGKVDDIWGWHFYHVWDGQDFIAMEDNQLRDDYGHGTHVAGTAGAMANNGIGIAGIAGQARLMTVKVLDAAGNGWQSDVAQGIVYAVDNGADIVNLSVGGSMPSQTLEAAIDYATTRGVLVVAATGSTGGAVMYPAAYEPVIAVAATDRTDARADFSNYGDMVDVAAPGEEILSTWPWEDGYNKLSGSSMATPHVAGLAALIWSLHPELPLSQVTTILTTTADDVNSTTAPGWDIYLGAGRINTEAALSMTLGSGDLHITPARAQLGVGTSMVITVTPPLTTGEMLTFSAHNGIVSPSSVSGMSGVVTTTLTAGITPGMAIVTATTETMSGTRFLRLLPGGGTSATLDLSPWVPMAGTHSLTVTMRAVDDYGNPPLDGTPVHWSAAGVHTLQCKSALQHGVSTITLITPVCGRGTVTATVEAVSVTAALPTSHCLRLPLVLR